MLRKLVLAALAAAAAMPAAAQPPRDDPRYDARYDARYDGPRYDGPRYDGPRYDAPVRRLPPAAELARARDTLDRVLDAFMDVRIGPVVDAVDPRARFDPYRPETVGDLASRDDPYARERLHAEVARTTAGIAVAAREVAVLTPALRRSIDDARRRMEAAMAPYDGW
jgi:hypothetical protein